MARPNALLRAKLMQYGIEHDYLSELMGRGRTYISFRMMGKRGWTQEEMYFLMDLLKIPYEEMNSYFPKIDQRLAS